MYDATSLVLNQFKKVIEDHLKQEKNVKAIRSVFKDILDRFEKYASEDEMTIYLSGLGSILISTMEDIDSSSVKWDEIPKDEVDLLGRIDGDLIIASEYKGQLWQITVSLDITRPLSIYDITQYDVDGFSNMCNLKIDVPSETFGLVIPYLEFYGDADMEDEDDMYDFDDEDEFLN